MGNDYHQLSRRERQIMDAVYHLSKATANQVLELMPDPPSNSTVRMLMRILEEKGFLLHEKDGRAFIYRPAHSPERAKEKAIDHLIQTFFGGSKARALAGLIDHSETNLTRTEIAELTTLIEKAQKEGR